MKLYTAKEAAEIIGITPPTLYGWIDKGIARAATESHGAYNKVTFSGKEVKRLKKWKQKPLYNWSI